MMKKITSAVEKYRTLILEAERYIWANPETGYKEFKTSKYLEEKFEELGYTLTRAEGITGFVTDIDTGKEGPTVMVMGELDSIICPGHPDADPTTGAVHSCGHNAQTATLLGIAAALTEEGMLDGLCGKIRLCAVPAEELLEIGYRSELKAKGVIRYFGGKSEFLSRGLFDGVDMAFMVHTTTGENFAVNGGSVGCMAKKIIYRGVAAHAGGAPWAGRNALYAANCGINAINAIRETFRDTDQIRVHPIITRGGDMVNAIPETVEMESYVRGKTYDAIVEANEKVNRALTGAALSLGVNVEIIDTPGYAPLVNDPAMVDLCAEAAAIAMPDRAFERRESYSSGSTDVGDLSCIMPVVQPYAAGARGKDHGNNYEIFDPIAACVENAKWQLCMLRMLLENGAQRAQTILESFEPMFPTAADFLAFQDSLNASGDRIVYGENKAEVVL